MSYKKQELPFERHLDSLVLLIFYVFCDVLCFCVCLTDSSCVLCVRCFQYFWIVHSWLTLRFSLSLIHHILSLLSDKQWNGLSFLSIKDHDIKVICVGSDGIKSMTFYLYRKERDLDVKTVYNTTVKEGVRYD